MLTRAVSGSLIDDRFGVVLSFFDSFLKRLSSDYLDRISDIESCKAPVLKTHDLFRSEFAHRAKYIFIFGDPLESAQSVEQMGKKHGIAWIEEHIHHLVGSGSPEDIFEKDVLNYEEQLKSWGNAQGVFIVHYDDLWGKEVELSQFLGYELRLPERRERAKKSLPPNYNKPLFERLKTLEQELRAKVL